MQKLAIRYKGKFTLNDLPYAASKAKREEFEAFKPSTDGNTIHKTEYLRAEHLDWPSSAKHTEQATCDLSGYHLWVPQMQPSPSF
jgi:hypothetical protein